MSCPHPQDASWIPCAVHPSSFELPFLRPSTPAQSPSSMGSVVNGAIRNPWLVGKKGEQDTLAWVSTYVFNFFQTIPIKFDVFPSFMPMLDYRRVLVSIWYLKNLICDTWWNPSLKNNSLHKWGVRLLTSMGMTTMGLSDIIRFHRIETTSNYMFQSAPTVVITSVALACVWNTLNIGKKWILPSIVIDEPLWNNGTQCNTLSCA